MMVLKWLRQTRKTVIFRNNAIDQALLESINAELAKQPGLSFSSLCKEALHQYLLSERAYSEPAQSSIDNRRIENLEAQLRSLEQRFSVQDKRRLDRLETQLQQLAVQVTQMGGTVPPAMVSPEDAADIPYAEDVEEPAIDDPVLSRLSGLIDDF